MAFEILAVAMLLAQQPPALDYSFFKERVQPILLKKRPGHARCVTCHEHGSPPLPLLDTGATNWSEDQSRKNFAIWKLFVVPGNPMKSSLLLHPLAEPAGGDPLPARGKHWETASEPERQSLDVWGRGGAYG